MGAAPLAATSPSRLRRSLTTAIAGVLALLGASGATPGAAAVHWHADLTQAKAASQISHLPVLILFVASWSEKSVNHDKTFLASEEAVALLTACFEPVRIDCDADPATYKRLGVSHIPTACVVDADERVLVRFDCPETSAAFVAAAGRAAQEAAVACAGPLPAPTPPAALAVAPPPPTSPNGTAPEQPLSAAADPPGLATPALASKPPQWPAETTSAPLGSAAPPSAPAPPSTIPGQTSIEPVAPAAPAPPQPPASGLAAALPNWLNPKATPPAAAPAASEPAAKKPNGFWATVQKPFNGLVGKSPKPSTDAPAPAEMPSTGIQAGEPGAPMPVGLEGYCAVTLVEKGAWVEGRAKWGVRHRGRTYLFAGPEEQKAFLANPDRFAPGLCGDDPVLAIDAGRQIPGQRQYGVSYRSKVYLFSSPDTQAAFKADPQKYAQRVQIAEQAGTTTVR
jgi:protein disulfide-isomerase